MKVALVNRMLGIRKSGGGIWDFKMAEQLRDRGVSVTFYVAKPLTEDLNEDLSPFDYVTVRTPHLQDLAYASPLGIGGALADIDSRLFASRVYSKLDKEKYDIIQINTNREFAKYAHQFDVPTILKLNGPPYSLWRDVVNPLNDSSYEVLDRFDEIITTGVTTRDVRNRTNCSPTEINPGVDTDQFTPIYGSIDEPKFLFVGRFVPAKNLKFLIDSFARFREKNPKSELILVGDGPVRSQIHKQIQKRDIEESVQLPGYVPRNDISKYYDNSDLFVLSSKHESFGIVLLEAMSSGLPVIAPDLGAIPRIVNEGENGLLFEPGSVSALVEAMEVLTTNEDRFERMAENGRRKALEEFDWDQRGQQLKQLYDGLVDEHA